MPDTLPQLSVDALAGQIKAKYPDYAPLDNGALVSKVIAKYPTYQNYLSVDALKGIAQGGVSPDTPLKEAALGALSGFAGVPETTTPVASMAKGLGAPVKPTLLERLDPTAGAIPGAIGMAKGIYGAGQEAVQGWQQGDPRVIAHGIGSLVGRGLQALGLGASGSPEAAVADAARPVEVAKPNPVMAEAAVQTAKPVELPKPEAPKPLEADLRPSARPVETKVQTAPLRAPETAVMPAKAILWPSEVLSPIAIAGRHFGPDELDSFSWSLFGKENWTDLSPEQQRAALAVNTPTIVGQSITTQTPAKAIPEAAPTPLVAKAPAAVETTPVPVVTSVPSKKFSLEDTIGQAVKQPNEQRLAVVKSKTADAAESLPKDQALALADTHAQLAAKANEQAQVIRSVLDRQGDVQAVREKLQAWSTERVAQVDEETGRPLKGTTELKFENPVSPAERDLYNQLLGRKLAEVKARDPETGRRIQPPKVNSPEEQAQVDEFIQRLTGQRDAIVSQIKAGFPTSPERVQEAAQLNDQITQLTGMRQKYPTGVQGIRGVAGKAEPVVNERGVWGPSPNAPLPELTKDLYARLIGKDPTTFRGQIKPELLEQKIGQLNSESDIRSQVARTLYEQHGEARELPKLEAVPQKEAAITPKSGRPVTVKWQKDEAGKWQRVKVAPESPRPAKARAADAEQELAANVATAKDLAANPPAPAATALPPKPAERPGYFIGKVLGPDGTQTGWKEIKLQGPGTPGIQQGNDQIASPIRQMAESLAARPSQGMFAKLVDASSLGDALASGKNSVVDWATHARAVAAGWIDQLRNPYRYDSLDKIFDAASKAHQYTIDESRQLLKAADAAHPLPLERVGMANYLNAGGDVELLTKWRDASRGALRKGYQAALDLDENSKATALNARGVFDDLWQQMHQEGVLQSFVDNYLPGVYKRAAADEAITKVRSAYRPDSLQPNPSLAKQKFYSNYFEAEQAGKVPLNKDVFYLMNRYFLEANKALRDRATIRSLHESNAADGMPILAQGGKGVALPIDAEHPRPAYAINSRIRPGDAVTGDGRPYVYRDYPQLRDWTYATHDEAGNPILVKGDAYVHPDSVRKLDNVLAASPIRQSAIGRMALKLSSGGKQLKLGLGGAFHQVNVEQNALIGYGINPFTLPKFNIEDPGIQSGLDHGLQPRDPTGHALYSEGLAGSWTGKVPLLGKTALAYQDWFWNERMPALVSELYKRRYDDLTASHEGDPAWDHDRIANAAVAQAHAAAGIVNYRKLGASAGMQDALRLMSLAPTYGLGEAAGWTQALRAGGRGQALALLRVAGGTYAGYRVLNAMLNQGDTHAEDQPFGVVFHGKVYSMRNRAGDLYNLLRDPLAYAKNRSNPFFVAPLLEAATGRDDLGRRVGPLDQVVDLAKQYEPIPLSQFLQPGSSTESLARAALQAFGVGSKNYYSPALTTARQLYFDSHPAEPRGSGNAGMRDIEQAARDKSPELNAVIGKAAKSGQVSYEQIEQAMANAQQPELVTRARQLNIEQLAQVWAKASPTEKGQLYDLVAEKAAALEKSDRNPAQKARWEKLLGQFK